MFPRNSPYVQQPPRREASLPFQSFFTGSGPWRREAQAAAEITGSLLRPPAANPKEANATSKPVSSDKHRRERKKSTGRVAAGFIGWQKMRMRACQSLWAELSASQPLNSTSYAKWRRKAVLWNTQGTKRRV